VKKFLVGWVSLQRNLSAAAETVRGLRGLRPLIEEECQAMGLTVSVENISLLREPIDRARAEGEPRGRAEGEARGRAEGEAQGRAEGEARGQALAIERVLQQRFSGRVPAGLADHLADLGPEALDEILQKSVTAASVEDALGSHVLSKIPGSND
jgi:flagellar biosynthesis/type III secretory pathway protein FliH